MTGVERFRDAIQSAGIVPPQEIVADGKLHRFSSSGKSGDDAGWYIYYDGEIPAGAFGCWRRDIRETWRGNIGRSLSSEETTAHKKKLDAIRRAREADTAKRHAEGQAKAETILKAAQLATGDHPYEKRKKLDACSDVMRGAWPQRRKDDCLLIPMYDSEGMLGNIQAIFPEKDPALDHRDKDFLYGARKAGLCFPIGQLPDDTTLTFDCYVSEGYATGMSIRMAIELPVVVAFDAGNISAVVKEIRECYPNARIIIAGDDDKWKVDAQGKPMPNKGRIKALEAAKRFNCPAIFPVFKDTSTKPTDFNDLHFQEGLEEVKAQLQRASNEQRPTPADMVAGVVTDTDDSLAKKFKVKDKGVFFHGHDKDGKPLPPHWICSGLDVTAKTRDAKSGEWGRLLKWKDDDGVLHHWAMPLELLQGDGSDVRRELARLGLTIAPGRSARDLLTSYLQVWPVEHRARCVERLGWHENVYVTPGETIGEADEIIVFQNAHAIEPALSVKGSVDEWRAQVAGLAAGNSRLVFALSAAFAGTLIDIADEDSGGFHLRGGSSSGKTTALRVGASVWGEPKAYSRLWRATTNGLEGLAALHNDGLLILDELNQIDPKDAGEAAYLLANGQAKARSSRTGIVRQSARWQLLFLSSGEESLTALMARAGKRTTAGQEIRLADIPADAGVGMGVFEVLNGQPTTAALVLALRDAATRYHGAVGVAWLRHIVTNRAKLVDFIADGIKRFVNEATPKNAAGQVSRVARRFALVAVAGELATHYGLTGWQKGEATKAARKCFDAWLESFGGTGNREERAMLGQVRAFFEAHGASRFQDMGTENDPRIVNRAGFYRTGTDGKREFFVLPEIFQRDVCAGYDHTTAAKALIAKGWLTPGGDKRPTQKPRLPGMGATRCYVFTARMWESEE